MNPTYLATARLLTEIAPVVFEGGIFALKGGTAINSSSGTCRASPSISISSSPTTGCLARTRWKQSTKPYERDEIVWPRVASRQVVEIDRRRS